MAHRLEQADIDSVTDSLLFRGNLRPVFAFLALIILIPGKLSAAKAPSVSQYGITWTFDKPYPVGQFITGDYWVVGPVTIVSVSPAPAPAPTTEPAFDGKSVYGATCLVDNRDLRNGSMIVEGPSPGPKNPSGFEQQGYDSRGVNYDPTLTVKYPLKLEADRSLISTVSSESFDAAGKLATPNIINITGFVLMGGKTMPLALQSAAVLTCLKTVPPADAFRPPYVGTQKPIYQMKDIHWDILPTLKSVPSVPDWDKMERLFERPWLDTTYSWVNYMMLPGENGPYYGRDFTRFNNIASLMLMLDVPKERKQKLMVGMVQLGIDLSGMTKIGRQYFPDGGHWMGRKWPILFASLMLDKPELRNFPEIKLNEPVYIHNMVTASPGLPTPTTLFQEDLDTYYGKGADGQDALWQCVFHTMPRDTYQEKKQADFNESDKFIENYRTGCSATWAGTALAALAMKSKAIWNHDAFFDYVDHWMGPVEYWQPPKWLPKGCTRTFDPFVEDMWKANRASLPDQSGGKDNVKWVWNEDKKGGHFVLNPKSDGAK